MASFVQLLVIIAVAACVASAQSNSCSAVLNGQEWTFPIMAPLYYYNSSDSSASSYILSPCSRVDTVIGNYTRVNRNDWYGWFWGYMSTFTAVNPTSTTEVAFTQTFTLGDQGWPCHFHDDQRRAIVNIYNTCPGSTTAGTYICNAFMDPLDICLVVIDLQMPIPPPHPYVPPVVPGGWSAAGIFFFVLFMLCLVGCIGGCIYNWTMVGKRGPDVIPGAAIARRIVAKIRGRGGSSNYNSGSAVNTGADETTSPSTDNPRYGTL